MIYCNVPLYEFETLRRLKNRGAIDISERVKKGKHLCSDLIIEENTSKNYCVYIGHQKNLKRRINEHFKGSNGTGCLSIFKHQKLRAYKWKVLFYEINKDRQLEDSNIFRTIIENNLRSKFGWPILCAK
jgi:hypothetical protein